MGKVILDMAMSLDGYIASGKNDYIYPIKDISSTRGLKKLIKKAGAVVMDMDAYNLANGDFTGYEYQVPVFVVTNKAPVVIAKGENDQLKFTFVENGMRSAIVKAKTAAGKKNIMVIGLAKAAQRAIRSGKVDEMIIRLIPVILGRGIRLLDNVGGKTIQMKIAGSKQFGKRIDIRCRFKRKSPTGNFQSFI